MKRILSLIVSLIIVSPLYAAQITHTDYTSQAAVTASGQNANENRIYNEFNGNIDNTNIKSAGITGTNIANGTITNSLMASNTLTNASMSSGTIQGTTANSGGTQGTILQGSVSTPDMRTNAITLLVSSMSVAASSHGTDILTKSITTIGDPVILIGCLMNSVNADGSGVVSELLNITRDTTALAGGQSQFHLAGQGAGALQTLTPCVMTVDTPGAGTYTYRLSYTVNVGTFNTSTGVSLFALEIRN